MQFVLIPFTICFLLYIRQENLYRFRTATALKITLTMTLAVCLIVALAREYSPVLLAAAFAWAAGLSSGRTPGRYATSSLDAPAGTIGHTIASFQTRKSIRTGRSLISLAFLIASTASSFVNARMPTQS